MIFKTSKKQGERKIFIDGVYHQQNYCYAHKCGSSCTLARKICPWAGGGGELLLNLLRVCIFHAQTPRVWGLKANGHKMRRTGRVAARYINKAAQLTILHPGVLGNTHSSTFMNNFFTAGSSNRERAKSARDAYLSFVIRIGAFLQH
jgi:hypothetical protein